MGSACCSDADFLICQAVHLASVTLWIALQFHAPALRHTIQSTPLPIKFIKNLHLKYFSFSERKKYDDSEEDPSNYEMSVTTRMLVSLTLFCLNASRLMVTFVPLAQRKRIEEAMKGVNMVIVE